MHVAQTAAVETFDLLSQAAKTGWSSLHCLSDGALDGVADEGAVDWTSDVEEVRLTDRMDETDDFVDSNEVGEPGDDWGLGILSAAVTVNAPLCRRSLWCVCSRGERGPASNRSESLADIFGDIDALYDPVTVSIVEVGQALCTLGLVFDERDKATENCDKVRDLL